MSALIVVVISGLIVNTVMYSRMGILTQMSERQAYVEPEVVAKKLTVTAVPTIPQAKPPEYDVEEGERRTVAYGERGRSIAYAADMGLKVDEGRVGEAVDMIISITNMHGGYLLFMSVGERDAHLTVKVPQDRFFAAIEDISRVGDVVGKSVSGIDVTDQIIDLRARIRNAEALETKLLELLEKAEDVGDMLEIMRELSRVREEIEVMRAQLENLEKSVAYSTITTWISEKEPRKEYVEILFKVLDSRDVPIPNVYLYVKDVEARKISTDEFGEARASFEKGQNITVISTFHRADGEILRKSLQDVADSNKTIMIKFDKPSEPPAVNPDWISDAASLLANYLIMGLMVVIVLVAPILFAVIALMAATRSIYAKIRRRQP